MITREYKGKKVTVTYRNDVIFKLTLGSNDSESKEILKFLVEAITGKKYKDLTVVNTESLGKYIFNKKNYLDIRATDEHGNIYNIEMQQSNLGENDFKRFQIYAYRTVDKQTKSGKSYKQVKPVDQIIFTTDRYSKKLVAEYKQREDSGRVLPYNLASFYFISLPAVEDIVREKREKHVELEDIEILSYIYQKEIDDDIISVSNKRQKRVITLMEKKYREASSDEEILDEALESALYEDWFLEQIEISERRGLQHGIQQGIQQGVLQERLSKVKKLIESIYNKEAKWLEECSIEELDKAFELAIQKTDYDELKKQIMK